MCDKCDELAEQTAAKDAEIERLRDAPTKFMVTGGPVVMSTDFDAMKRERDSLREALERISELPHYEASKIADAALKAGKDGQQ